MTFRLAVSSVQVAYARALVRVSELPKAPFLHCSFVVRTQVTVKVLVAVKKPLLAVLVKGPHSVEVATMVSVKGAAGLEKRLNEHVTVFPLVVHWLLGSLSSTESMSNSDGSWSTRGNGH